MERKMKGESDQVWWIGRHDWRACWTRLECLRETVFVVELRISLRGNRYSLHSCFRYYSWVL